MPALLNQTKARWLALISTGSVMKLNKVVDAKRIIPNSINWGNVLINSSHQKHRHLKILSN
jgi:hypothetical protein